MGDHQPGIRPRLTPRPVDGARAWPSEPLGWVYVADPSGVVALRKDLAGLILRAASEGTVTEHLVDNGSEPHSIDHYLNTPSLAGLGTMMG